MRFGRRLPAEELAARRAAAGASPGPVLAAVRASQAKPYADGIADGIIIALELLLGESPTAGGAYTGPLAPELEEWARAALDRAKAERG